MNFGPKEKLRIETTNVMLIHIIEGLNTITERHEEQRLETQVFEDEIILDLLEAIKLLIDAKSKLEKLVEY